jgi:hypothetical protein
MDYPRDVYMSPQKAIQRFRDVLNKFGIDQVQRKSKFKQDRELWIAATLLLGCAKANDQQYWMRPSEDVSGDIDVRAVTCTKSRTIMFHDIQITEFEGHSSELLGIIEKKIRRLAGQKSLDLLINIRDKAGTIFDCHKIARAVRKLNPTFLNIWFVVDDAADQWLYHIRKVWPNIEAYNYNVETSFSTVPSSSWIKVTTRRGCSKIEYLGDQYNLPLPS